MTARLRLLLVVFCAVVAAPAILPAQTVLQQPSRVLSLPKGASLLFISPNVIDRWSVADPDIADVTLLSPTELMVIAKELGSTSFFVWVQGVPQLYSVEVTVDTPALERYLAEALPGERIQVSASGNSVTLSGTINDPFAVDRAVAIAQGTGVASVINNLIAPPAVQVLLRVRFAEVNRSQSREFSSQFVSLNPQDLDSDGNWLVESISDGLVRILLSNPGANIDAMFRASVQRGILRSLAEPNLLTLPGKEANFLAGGEFPYPTIQAVSGGGGTTGAVTIAFREFGVRLKFLPTITQSGSIRLQVSPEVSQLDFANGLVIQGFTVPSILVRRAQTEVELAPGQYLALAGLIDNSTLENVTKIPILGDIPILGAFFRSTSARARQTELLVLVSPRLVGAATLPDPLPTDEPEAWKWPGWMRQQLDEQAEMRTRPPPLPPVRVPPPPPPPPPPSPAR